MNKPVRELILFFPGWLLFLSILLTAPILAQMETRSTQLPKPEARPFRVKEIEVLGVTLLSSKEVEAMISPYLGKEQDLPTLERLASQFTEEYKKRGYLLAQTFVPPPDMENGIVEIDVIEGWVDKIIIKGNKTYRTEFIQNFLTRAVHHRLLHVETFERALYLLNEFPELHVQVNLEPGEEPGTTEIHVQVKDKLPLHGQLDYNNYGNRLIGQNHASVELVTGNLTGAGDILDVREVLSFQSVSPPFIQFSYTTPLGYSGLKLISFYANADIKVGQEFEVQDIRGVANIYGFTLIYPLRRSSTDSSDISLSYNTKDVRNLLQSSNSLLNRDNLRELVLGYRYNWITDLGQNFLETSIMQGLGPFLGGMQKGDPFISRPFEDDTFMKFNASYTHIHKVFKRHLIVLRGSAQWAASALGVTEQWAIGGPDSVRGYPQSQYLGDHGWNFGAEFRFPITDEKSYTTNVQGAIFLETGFMSFINPIPAASEVRRHITGGGFGIRATLGPSVSVRGDLGFPIHPHNTVVPGLVTPILYASFTGYF